MTNMQIAAIFRELADVLVHKKENWFKVKAYRRVADEIENLPDKLVELSEKDRLKEIPGVGKAIEKKIKEIISTGKLELLEKLKKEI